MKALQVQESRAVSLITVRNPPRQAMNEIRGFRDSGGLWGLEKDPRFHGIRSGRALAFHLTQVREILYAFWDEQTGG